MSTIGHPEVLVHRASPTPVIWKSIGSDVVHCIVLDKLLALVRDRCAQSVDLETLHRCSVLGNWVLWTEIGRVRDEPDPGEAIVVCSDVAVPRNSLPGCDVCSKASHSLASLKRQVFHLAHKIQRRRRRIGNKRRVFLDGDREYCTAGEARPCAANQYAVRLHSLAHDLVHMEPDCRRLDGKCPGACKARKRDGIGRVDLVDFDHYRANVFEGGHDAVNVGNVSMR